jgi:hypothetical protein
MKGRLEGEQGEVALVEERKGSRRELVDLRV